MTAAIDQILREIKELAVGLARVEGKVSNLEEGNKKINKIVFEGNGKAPLTDRVDCLEEKEESRKRNEVTINEANTENRKNKWDLKTKVFVAFCVALFGMISSVGSAYFVVTLFK